MSNHTSLRWKKIGHNRRYDAVRNGDRVATVQASWVWTLRGRALWYVKGFPAYWATLREAKAFADIAMQARGATTEEPTHD